MRVCQSAADLPEEDVTIRSSWTPRWRDTCYDVRLRSWRDQIRPWHLSGKLVMSTTQWVLVALPWHRLGWFCAVTTGLPNEGLPGPMDEQSRGWNLNEIVLGLSWERQAYSKLGQMLNKAGTPEKAAEAWPLCATEPPKLGPSEIRRSQPSRGRLLKPNLCKIFPQNSEQFLCRQDNVWGSGSCSRRLMPIIFSRERLRRVLRKKAAVILDLHTFTPADLDLHTLTSADLHLHTFTSADLDLHTLTSADLDIHTFTPADLDLHTLTSADLHLHTFTSADLHLHTFTPADLDLHILTSADLDLHTLTSADLHLHTFTPADLDLHTLTPADLDLHTLTSADLDLHILTPADLDLHTLTSADLHLHTFTPADLDLHTLTSADLDLHTFTSADLDLHTLTSADLDLHTFTSADLFSLFFYSLLRRGRCRRSATKRNPFARNGRWTSKT